MAETRLSIRLAILAAIVIVDVAAWGVRATMAPEARGVIDPAVMRPDGARAWSAPLDIETAWWVRVPNDGLGASQLTLVERREGDAGGARTLGPARAPPDVVRERGGGAFTHWGEILFSTHDGSDPRTNGLVYEWRSPTVLHPRLSLLLLMATAATILWTLSGWFAAVPHVRAWVFAGTVALLVAAWNLEAKRLYPGWINVDWDTASYLGWSPERTAGYPLLLEIVEGLTIPAGDLRFLLFVQLNAMLASFAWLGLAVDRLLRTRVTGLAVFILLATSPRLMAFPFNVLTEAFFVTGTCVLLALLARAAADDRGSHGTIGGASDAPRHGAGVSADARGPVAVGGTARPLLRCAAIGAVFALTELVRPAAFGMLGMVLLPVVWRRGARGRTLAAIVAPYAIIMLIASTASWLRFGFFATSSMGPVSLLGHVAWNIRGDQAPECPGLAARVEARLAPVLAKRPATLSWPGQYFFVTSDEYNELLWANVMPETEAWVRERQTAQDLEAKGAGAPLLEGPERARAERRELMRARGALARHALLADLPAYAKHVGAHVWGFWQSAARPAPLGFSLKVRVPRGVESAAQLWPEAKARFAWMGPPPAHESAETAFDRVTWMERWRLPLDSTPSLFWKLSVAATLAGVVLAPFSRRLTPAGRLLALAGVGFQGSALLVAAVAAVIARYVDAVEPLTVIACVAAVACIGETIARIGARGRAAP